MKIVKIRNIFESKEVKEADEIDSFTHDNDEYDLQKVKKIVHDHDIKDMEVNDLKWVLKDTDIQKKRLKTADIDNPIIITHWKNKWVVLDGAHRLTNAVEEKIKYLPTKTISATELATCKLVA